MFSWRNRACILAMGLVLLGCGGDGRSADDPNLARQRENVTFNDDRTLDDGDDSFLNLFGPTGSDEEINVNKHLWAASLDVLSFLPVEAVDPFSGVIATDWGRINGRSPVYRATVYVTGPALEARSLRVAVFRQSGGRAVAVGDEVAGQVEDAILTRARQLRIADGQR